VTLVKNPVAHATDKDSKINAILSDPYRTNGKNKTDQKLDEATISKNDTG
jgi:hypothetical protein